MHPMKIIMNEYKAICASYKVIFDYNNDNKGNQSLAGCIMVHPHN